MAKHKSARNPFKWIPVITLAGLAALGIAGVNQGSTPHTALRSTENVSRAAPVRSLPPGLSEPQKAPVPAVQQTYTIRSGDTLWSVAQAHCGSAGDDRALASANHIGNANAVFPGKVLVLDC